MIYIDPPYNTGSDGFVYADDRKFTIEELSSLAGIDDIEAKRILDFTTSKSNSHSAWLTFMYPRLYIARELLRDDGVIFISIDDNEQAQLKLLCDEVFGEENFVNLISVKMSETSGVKMSHVNKRLPKIKESILLYKKSEFIKLNPIKIKKDSQGEKLDSYLKYYSKVIENFNDPVNEWVITSISDYLTAQGKEVDEDLVKSFQLNNAERVVYRTNNPSLENLNFQTKAAQVKSKQGIEYIWWEGKQMLFLVDHVDEYICDFWTDISTINLNKEGGVDFPKGKKPLKLLDRCLKLSTNKCDVILDFFAGSGTTAHAVMQLNAEDNSNRQFICVQLPEKTDEKSEAFKAGYATIFDITRERISRAAAKIKAEYPLFTGDVGFKIFETVPVFDGYLDAPDALTPNLNLFDASHLNEQDLQSLLTTWTLQDGVPLTQNPTSLDLAGYTATQVGEGGRLLYFMHTNLTLASITALLTKIDDDLSFTPKRLVVFGYALTSKTQREMTDAIKQYNNRKGIELILDIRF